MIRLLLPLALLVACDATTDEPSDADTDPSEDTDTDVVDTDPAGATDLTDAVLTRRSGDCADYDGDYVADVLDIQRDLAFAMDVGVTADATSCTIVANGIPNHDFNDASARFATAVAETSRTLTLPRNPSPAAAPASLELRSYDAVLLNGVVVDLLAAGCFGVGDGRVGCFDLSTPWRYDPMAPSAGFGTDVHNAHTQPDGGYHYHGDPGALWDDMPAAAGSPVIGFAADGFPIFGGWFHDGTELRRARSGYTLQEGTRPGGPGGTYDGTFVDDWVFTDAGDLDACNGMTVDGQYGYYVTDTYPWILGCFTGTPDPSFDKGPPR